MISRRSSQPQANFSAISSSEALHEMSLHICQHPCLLVSREHASLIFCLRAVLIWLIAPRLHSHQLVELLAVSLIAEGGSIPPVGPKSSTCLLQCRQLFMLDKVSNSTCHVLICTFQMPHFLEIRASASSKL